jgi:uncharacterized membrane protein YfbV (UPF0208 family)
MDAILNSLQILTVTKRFPNYIDTWPINNKLHINISNVLISKNYNILILIVMIVNIYLPK